MWVNRHSIDLRLAEGESISSPDLAHRAKQLNRSAGDGRWRRASALLEDARASRPLSSAVPIQRRAILRARSSRLAAIEATGRSPWRASPEALRSPVRTARAACW